MPSRLELTGADALRPVSPVAQLLSNGRYTTLLTTVGGGYSAFAGFALTRWTPDRTRDADGWFVYVRDLDAHAVWSAGARPIAPVDDRYVAQFGPGFAVLTRDDGGVETTVEVCVAPEHDVELRRVTLVNRGDRARRLDVTTYAECVLNTAAGDASHPAFSKLFVQTERDAATGALLARRRLRSPDDTPLWMAHALWGERAGGDRTGDEGAECETDRARFIGRGRTLSNPRALDRGAELSGTVGNVLDPILALRHPVSLGAGESVRLVALIAAAHARDDVTALVARYGEVARVDEAFAGAVARAQATLTQATLTQATLTQAALAQAAPSDLPADRLHVALGALAYAHPDAGDVSAWRTTRDDVATLTVTLAAAHTLGERSVPSRDASRRRTERDVHTPVSTRAARDEHDERRATDEPLRFFNGHGGFSADGTEYVVRVRDGVRPPLPWVNVVANERVGFIATESGAGYTWSANSRENRLTPWFNDPVVDPHGEALYVRDDETGALWSPTPGPVGADGAYEVRHGFGYTTWRLTTSGLAHEVTACVPRHDPVKLVRLTVRNTGDRPRRLTACSYAQLVLGVYPWETGPSVETRVDGGAILATNARNGEFAPLVAFAAAVAPSGRRVSLTADRAEFLGSGGDVGRPAALRDDAPLSGRSGTGIDPCAAFAVPIELAPGETADCVFVLGQGEDEREARALLDRYRAPDAFDAALSETRAFWRETLGGVQVETPSPELDLMVNGWLSYQNLSCRVWGRSAYYQSGGAFGFRDQLQDCGALLHLAPELTRAQIVLHAAHQFVEGDVLHWWHPPTSKGIRTRFADDLLWLPFVASYYVESTGDATVLDEEARFVTAERLPDGEDEMFVFPKDSGERGSVYEHCVRALDRSLTAGAHGLPLIGTGDWNDGMNRVGREGRGESVWLGFFLAHILGHFIPVCERRGDAEHAARYREYLDRLAAALNADGAGWDGAWYRRAYYDDGSPLGAATNDECRIDTIAQAWAVISRVAPPDRAAQALDAMERHLVAEREGIIRLLTPAFDRTPHDPGYIKGYLPGVRENGGQYTHGALWAVKALAELGRGDRAARLLEMLSPVSHGRDAAEVDVYRTEPYVIAADVYGVAPHVGRGGWTWYTGSAGWMFRVAVESILGLTLDGGDTLVLRPSIPSEWPGFTVAYRLADRRTSYRVVVSRTDGASAARVDGGEAVAAVDGALRLPLVRDGGTHAVDVALGADVGARYVARHVPR